MAAAVIWGPEHKELEQDCRRCHKDPSLRIQWGCDAPAPTPIMWLDCWACLQSDPDPACRWCRGTGRVDWRRCPMSIDPQAWEVCRMVDLAENCGILPRAGGWLDQPPEFRHAFGFVIGRKAKYRDKGKDPPPRLEDRPLPDPDHSYLRPGVRKW